MSSPPTDPSRRRFFRQFAGEVVSNAAKVVGAVEAVRQESAASAQALLGAAAPDEPANPATTAGSTAVPANEATANAATANAATANAAIAGISAGTSAAPPPPPTGFRTPFRYAAGDELLVIDQRALPDRLVELPVRNAYEGARLIKEMAVRGAPAIGQVAALSLAMSGWLARNAPASMRQTIVRTAARTLLDSRPTAVNLAWAVQRVMDRFEAAAEGRLTGEACAAVMRDEAERIVAEATDDHGRLAEAGLAVLPDVGDRELRLLTHCNTGPLACGQFGTALGIIQAAHHAERPLQVWVDETRPYLQGARLTAWELEQAGVPHTLIPDVAAGSLMASGKVDAILVGADRVAANGDTANKVGTYPLAVLAQRHGVPFYVCAPLSSIDLATPDGTAIPIEERAASEVTEVRGVRIAPAGTIVWNPAFDVTPAELITGIVTDEGVLRAPFNAALRQAMARRDARRAADRAAAITAGSTGASGPTAPEPGR